MPKRIQLRRTKGWRLPEGAVVVSRPSKWGNEFQVWENPRDHWHAESFDVEQRCMVTVRVADREGGQAVAAEAYRLALPFGFWDMPSVEQIREALADRDLACWCALDAPCHGDVLLEIANAHGGPETPQ